MVNDMGRPPKKNREPQKRPVSLVELKAQYQALKHQTDTIALAVEKMTRLQAPDVPVKGPARIQRALYSLNGYLADLTAATMRLDLELGGGPAAPAADG